MGNINKHHHLNFAWILLSNDRDPNVRVNDVKCINVVLNSTKKAGK